MIESRNHEWQVWKPDGLGCNALVFFFVFSFIVFLLLLNRGFGRVEMWWFEQPWDEILTDGAFLFSKKCEYYYRILSHHIVSYHIASYHNIFYRNAMFCIISYCIASYHNNIVPHRIASDRIWHLIPLDITLYHIGSYFIASHCLKSNHIVLYRHKNENRKTWNWECSFIK